MSVRSCSLLSSGMVSRDLELKQEMVCVFLFGLVRKEKSVDNGVVNLLCHLIYF